MKILRAIARGVLITVAIVIVASPYLVNLFGLSLIATSVAGWLGVGWAGTYAVWGWAVYAGMALLTPFLMATFTLKLGDIGLTSFRSHFTETVLKNMGNLLYSTLLWPLGWWWMHRFCAGWGMTFDAVFINAWDYWVHDRRKGITLDVHDLTLGGTRSTRVKDMEEGMRQVADELRQRQHPERN